MKYLLDTHIVLWWLSDLSKLSKNTLKIIRDQNNRIFISAVSVLEISIKVSIGKLEIKDNYLEILEKDGFEFLFVNIDDANYIRFLPLIHKDPFDRLLIGQAMNRNLILISKDLFFQAYDVKLLDA